MQRLMKSDNIPQRERVSRYDALSDLLKKNKAHAILLTDLNSIRYFTGFTGSSALLLFEKERATFLTDGRYETQSKSQVKGAEIVIFKKMLDSVKSLVVEKNIKKIAFESAHITYSLWNDLQQKLETVEFIPLKDETRKLRYVKDDNEVSLMKEGALLAKEAFLAVKELVQPGIRENELALQLEVEARKRGAEKVAFDIIVASGINSALPHAFPGEKKIEDGDLVVLDFGVVLNGYHTDETCTFRVGNVDERAHEIYNIVKEAHDLAIAAVRPGVNASTIDAVARDYISKKGYGQYFGHGTGHGVGLEIHELPVISALSDELLQEGMVFTIEPGIYIPKLGGVRIEDMVLVTSDGCEIITECNKFM